MIGRRTAGSLAAAAVAAAVVGYALFVARPAGPRSLRAFDPDRTAALELDVWQAADAGQRMRLFRDLLALTREQNRYPWATAARASVHLTRAMLTFARIGDHDDAVLADLTRAYTIARDWTGATFDPAAVARAELAWWVARRVPGEDSAEHVGGLIADENALLYGVPRERVLVASILRARADQLRDRGRSHAEWDDVARLLHASYGALYDAVQPGIR